MKRLSCIKSLTFNCFLTVLAIIIFSTSCDTLKINQYKNHQQNGCWVYYTDNSKTKILSKGKFKNGTQVGKWIYNTTDGEKDRIEIYRGEKIKIKHYHPNGQLALAGKANIVLEEKGLHFYYYGRWKHYLPNGKLQKISFYEKGKSIKENFIYNTGSKEFDLLAAKLKQIEKDYSQNKNDTTVFKRIDNIIAKYGYPAKQQVGKDNDIIFFIISSANWKIKEKYFEVFKEASLKNDISLKDMAYFEDKLLIAKEGYQLYGTQSHYNEKTKQTVYYPVKDLVNMNERRLKMGLEVESLLDYSERK